MLAGIQAYYDNTDERVRSSAGLSAPIDSHVGVKQGCPLSPTLFGLFIDEIEDWLLQALPNSSIFVGNKRTPILLYADDLVLLASSPGELQALIDVLDVFCVEKQLCVSLKKTQVVVFCGPRHPQQPETHISYRGSPISQVAEYRYLGVVFHWKEGPTKGGSILIQCARRAAVGILQRSHSLHLRDIDVLTHLFRTLVTPILTYGCEVWGSNKRLQQQADQVLFQFLRRVYQVPLSTDTACLLEEARMTAPSAIFLQRMALT